MFGLLDIPKLLAAAALGLVIGAVPAYFKGKEHQRQAMAVEALESTVNILRKKGEIDAQVSGSSAVDLCADFGLSDDDKTECVRRLVEDDTNVGNVGVRPQE